MGLTKSELFSESQNEMAAIAKALAHPARIAILQHLVRTNVCICGELVDELGLAQATISQHLKELKNAGIIQGTIDGVKVCYCIEPNTWALLQKLFGDFMVSYKLPDTCC